MEINRDLIMDKVGGDKKKYKRLRTCVVFHELFHINPKKSGFLRGHNVQDFLAALKISGIGVWDYHNIPDILKKGSVDDTE